MIINLIKRIKQNEFLRNSLILFTASQLMNVLGFLFQIFAVNKLGPVDYGIFGSLSAIILFLTVPLTTVQTTITKFVSTFKVSNEYGKIRYLFTRSIFKLLLLGIIFVILFYAFSKLIADFLHIDSLMPLYLLGIFFLFSLLLPINRGVLQGLQNVKDLGYTFVFEGLFKLVFGVTLILMGFGVNGAVAAFIVSYAFPFFLSFYSLRFLFKIKKEKFETSHVYFYSFPVLIATLLLTGFYNIDVILVKHFFAAKEAGYYAAASLLAKIVFFGSGAISLVLFPQVNELQIKNMDHRKVLYRAIILISFVSFFITGFYFLFPEIIIRILGSQYEPIRNIIGLFGLVTSIFSLVYIISFYNLSLKRYGFIYLLGFFLSLEVILIYMYHSSIIQIISILLVLLSFLLFSLFVYTLHRK